MVAWEDMVTEAIFGAIGTGDLVGMVVLIMMNIFMAVQRLPTIITLIANGVLILSLAYYGVLTPLLFALVVGLAYMLFRGLKFGPFSERY